MANSRVGKTSKSMGPSRGSKVFVGVLYGLGLILFLMALLLPTIRATIEITSSPEGASIYVDCKEHAETTPATIEIEPGNHIIGVKKPGMRLEKRFVDIGWLDWGKQDESFHADLKRIDRDFEESNIIVKSVSTRNYPTIRVTMLVRDNDGQYIKGLASEDFQFQEIKEELCLEESPEILNFVEVGRAKTAVDIVFVLDTTGSMGSHIHTMQVNLIEFAERLVLNKVNFRLAGISFGDEVPYRRIKDFTEEFENEKNAVKAARDFQEWIATLKANGGADGPENSLEAIINAAELEFRPNCQKYVVLITDAPPHTAGDGGSSDTEATFDSTRISLRSAINFCFSAPQKIYSDSLRAHNLGWPFSKETMTEALIGEILSKYIITLNDAFGDEIEGDREIQINVSTPLGDELTGKCLILR